MVAAGRTKWVQRGLTAAQYVLLLAVGLAAWRLVAPPAVPSAVHTAKPAVTTRTADASEAHPLSWYAPIWERDLRRPPVDPVADTKRKAKKPKPKPLRLALLGTVIEPADRYAVFRKEDGHIVVKRVRDDVDRFTIAGIDRGRAELVRGERRVNITVPGYEPARFGEVR